MVTKQARVLARETGLTLPQLTCLRVIYQLEEPTLAKIADHAGLGPSTVTGIIDRLERAELIVRERSTTDRRKVFARTTDKGRALLDSAPAHVQDRFAASISKLSPDAVQLVRSSLEQLAEIMDADTRDAAPILSAAEQLDAPLEGSDNDS